MARNSARESIFWSGLKSEVPQSKGIAVEPIVTMGAIARLHFEHGWPLDCLGTQPTKWKFDLAAYNTDGEAILCEVKRRPRDVERMCAYFAGSFEPKSLGELKNLSRKLDYLRGSPAGIFWGLAPGQEEHIHVIERGAEPGEFRLHKGSLSDLDYRA